MEEWGKREVSSPSPARGASGKGRLDHFLYNDQGPASGMGRIDRFLYNDRGPSSYNRNSYHEQGEGARYLNPDLQRPSRFENLENSRAELLRKLDELKDHLSRSCEVTDEPRQRMMSPAVNNPYVRNHAAYVDEGLSTSHGVNKHPFDHGSPYSHGYSSSSRDSHSRRRYPNDGSSYADSYGHPQSQYMHQPYHEPRHGYRGAVNYPSDNYFHNRTCSCVHCFDKNWDLPANVDPSCLYNQRSPHVLSSPSYDHHLYDIEHGPHGHQSGGYSLHTSHPQPSVTRDSTELDFENDGFRQSFPRKMEEVLRNRHMMHPVAGGAPFIACSSCFQLLTLPSKRISSRKSHQKLKCGSCSSIILLDLKNKALTEPLSGSFDHVVTEMVDSSSLAVDENVGDTCACSDSNDNSLPKVSLEDKKSDSDECEKQLEPLSTASSLSNDKQIPDSLTSEKDCSSSAELPVAEVESIPHPIMSTKESPDHCPANIVANQPDDGEKGTKSEFDHSVTWQHSVRDSAVSTDMSSKGFPKSFVSQDTWDESKEKHSRGDKGAESSSSESLDDSRSGDFGILPKNVEFGTSQVFVNGFLIPEHLVQKAELLAGPIQPGEYWYAL